MDGDDVAKLTAAMGGVGAAMYGVFRMVTADRRQDKVADTTHDSWSLIVSALRDEVKRLSERLALVEEQNTRCEARNDALHLEIVTLKKRLQLA
jgi:hypothetical protein